MAHGGHGWPNGQFHPQGGETDNAMNSHDPALGYGDGFAEDNFYLPSWGAVDHPGASDPQFYPAPDYYPPGTAYNDTTRSVEHSSPAAAQPASYPDGSYHDPAFVGQGQQKQVQPQPQQQQQQPQQQQQQHPSFQHFSVQSNHGNPQPANSFTDNSWQPQPTQPSHSQYPTPLRYEDQVPQNLYQQQLQQSHAHTPPPAARASGHFAVNHGGQSAFRAELTPNSNHQASGHSPQQPPNPATSHYQFQVNQGQYIGSPYQTPVPAPTQSPVGFQGQLRYSIQPPQVAGQVNLSAASPQPTHTPGNVPVQRTASAMQNPPAAQSNNPAVLPYVPPAASQTASSHAQTFIEHPAPGPMQGVQNNATLTYVPSRPPFDPIAAGGFTEIRGCPNLFVADSPVDGSNVKPLPEKAFHFVAQFNARDVPLLSSYSSRLPCEIQRDWDWLHKQEKVAEHDAKKRAIAGEKARLDSEMTQLTGESIGPSGKHGRKKSTAMIEGKAPSARRPESESSDDSSEYESDSDGLEETKEDQEARKIKKSAKPSDPIKAAEYDIIKIVWRDPAEAVQPNATGNAIHSFGVYIEKLWNRAKDLKKDVKAAKEKKSKQLAALEAEHLAQLNLIRAAVGAAIKYAEPSVLENMGGNHKLAVILWNALRSSLASKDFNGPFPKAILRLFSQFTTMERGLVVNVLKVPEYQKKHLKDFDKICHGYLDQILLKAKRPAADADKKAKEGAAASSLKESTSLAKKTPVVMAKDLVSASKKPASADLKKVQPGGTPVLEARKVSNGVTKTTSGSPSKRPRDDDVDSRATKKVAMDGSSNSSAASKTMSNATAAKTTTIVQPRPKAGGSILPGRARPAAKPAVKKPEPQPTSTSSMIGGLLAEITKPKSPPRQKEEPSRASETPEEKARRLRKEARRGLRVVWKPDHELEEVRIFQHDAAEDEGRASNMIRDARDNRSEGQALKRARVHGPDGQDQGAQKDYEDEEEEDTEEGKPKEIALKEWRDPPSIIFSHIDNVNPGQRDKSYTSRGGNKEFHTEEQGFMEKYEQTHLMNIYTSAMDIPDTPKSPPRREAQQPSVPPQAYQLHPDTPGLQEIHLRATEAAQFGPSVATQRMIERSRTRASPERAARLDKLSAQLRNKSHSTHVQPYAFAPSMPPAARTASSSAAMSRFSAMTQTERDAEVLRVLSSDAVRNWVDPIPVDPNNLKTQRRDDYGDARIQAHAAAFEDVAHGFIGKQFPATEPPEHMRSNPDHVKEWQIGYNKDMAAKATHDAKDRAMKLAEEFARKNAAASHVAAQPAVPQATQDPNAAAWAMYFAQMNQGQGQPQPGQGSQLTYDQYAAIIQQTQALQAQQAAQPQAPSYQHQQQGTPDANAQIGSLLAALGGAQASQPPNPGQGAQDPNAANAAAWAAYYASVGQGAGQAAPTYQQPQQAAHQPNRERERERDRGGHSAPYTADGALDYGPSEYESRDKGSRGRKDNKEAFRGGKDYDRKGINRSLIGTKPCTFWAQGKCAKGDQCTFRHDPNDLK
ncbi:hypothetical protein JX265_012915 [Neoarthrinium moseri]|uniref:C3H1-type domain-containing protein n=1 Tax=Neoarthrinium moseri TaxID=1658444 RepID=A0A9P9W9S9_9PEZI|nr:hypothetical protein JX265_012915 [Neoarthrinium moseri]